MTSVDHRHSAWYARPWCLVSACRSPSTPVHVTDADATERLGTPPSDTLMDSTRPSDAGPRTVDDTSIIWCTSLCTESRSSDGWGAGPRAVASGTFPHHQPRASRSERTSRLAHA